LPEIKICFPCAESEIDRLPNYFVSMGYYVTEYWWDI